MRRRPEPRDLRSLERPGLRKTFEPLDERERLPRELLLAGRRQRRWYEQRRLLTITGWAYLPTLVLLVLILASLGLSPVLAFAMGGVALAAIYALVLIVGR